MTPSQVRALIRSGGHVKPTAGLAPGFAQANLVILKKELAYDFLLFCQRNPKPCPVLEVTDVGSFEAKLTAPGSDLRTDLPRYRVYEQGKLVDEPTDIRDYWRDDFVSFLLGCSFSFESALMESGLEVRHITDDCNVPMYVTNIECQPAGVFSGPVVVSMRPYKPRDAIRAVQITSRYPAVHGAPIHLGDPDAIGIRDLDSPEFGDSVKLHPGEDPVFWACGVTPQAAIMRIKPDLVITHSPGHMFITDLKDRDLAII
ncbi:MAG TPA: putative hydro-lyase [Bacillota bacterium]|nr:putative hydro-lyase [Bacillota bacterium]